MLIKYTFWTGDAAFLPWHNAAASLSFHWPVFHTPALNCLRGEKAQKGPNIHEYKETTLLHKLQHINTKSSKLLEGLHHLLFLKIIKICYTSAEANTFHLDKREGF